MKIAEHGALLEVTDRQLELELLGCMVESPTACGELLRKLEPADFATEAHAALFRLIARAYEAGRPTDPVAINAEIRRDGDVPLFSVLADAVGSCAMPAYGVARAAEIRRLARLRRLEAAGISIVDLARSPGEIDDKIASAEANLASIGVERDSVFAAPAVASVAFDILDQTVDGGPPGTVSTGIPNLDHWMAGGLWPSHLVILAARPSIGKTAFACTIARNALRRDQSVLFASLEMSPGEVGSRLALIDAGSKEPAALTAAIDHLGAWPLRVVTAPMSVAGIRAEARRMRPSGLNLIVVDYVGLLSGGPADNRAGEIGFYARSLKLLAQELGIPVLLLAQVNRGVESRQNPRPLLSDLRDSGELEQHADDVLLLHRKRGEEDAEIHIAKQRSGATGVVKVLFQAPLMRFVSPSPEGVSEPHEDEPQQRSFDR